MSKSHAMLAVVATLLAACLDAAATFDSDKLLDTSMTVSQQLLQRIEKSIKLGLPELADEFSIECQRVWRGSGSITAMHVTVHSIYQHKPVAVPQPALPDEDKTTNGTSTATTEVEVQSTVPHHDHGHEQKDEN